MSDPHVTIINVDPLADRWVRLTFADGAIHEVDLGPLLATGGVFAPIRDDRALFEAVAVDPESHTICWPGDIDLDPYVLRGEESPVSSTAYARRVITPV